jgi:Stage II sporulation protein E (SpoIIE)
MPDCTRGRRVADVSIAAGDLERGVLKYAGLGNVAGTILLPGGGRHHLVSTNGTAGHQARRIQEFQYPLPAGSIVVVHSDGLNSLWDLAPYPGVWSRHRSVIAGVLFRDFSRRRDDVTVVVMRARPAAGE